ncbi:hypothetical protein L6452_23883 [Arctium lappa]|uniref:Uncharacterized protein n=1 Tax=Arctium lappa TaxID=4217 RepID=A0ACB9A8F7_ARCLA|nr:hypothetical protein L6452_23883 [Arctium lappa]
MFGCIVQSGYRFRSKGNIRQAKHIVSCDLLQLEWDFTKAPFILPGKAVSSSFTFAGFKTGLKTTLLYAMTHKLKTVDIEGYAHVKVLCVLTPEKEGFWKRTHQGIEKELDVMMGEYDNSSSEHNDDEEASDMESAISRGRGILACQGDLWKLGTEDCQCFEPW